KFCQSPIKVCHCCHRTWYPDQGHTVRSESVRNFAQSSFTHLSPEFDYRQLWLCRSCRNYIDKGKVPNLAVCNGLQLDEIPPKLASLNLMEQRLISTAHWFMTIIALPKGQTATRGMTITFPFDVGNVVETLPRPPGNEGCVVVRVEKARPIVQLPNAQGQPVIQQQNDELEAEDPNLPP
ncbi:hypothetical protein DUNSADRAFT_6894, partial [Dunaliella salina]